MMIVKSPEKSVVARLGQATAITFVLYLMMVMSHSQPVSTASSGWRSTFAQAELPSWLIVEAPILPRLLW